MILVDEPRAGRHPTVLAAGAKPAAMHVRGPDDLFRLMYTSGTTDRPKGVMHTLREFLLEVRRSRRRARRSTARERLLVTGPLYHVGAFDLPGIAVLWVGGMLYVHRDFDAAQVLASIEERESSPAPGLRRSC